MYKLKSESPESNTNSVLTKIYTKVNDILSKELVGISNKDQLIRKISREMYNIVNGEIASANNEIASVFSRIQDELNVQFDIVTGLNATNITIKNVKFSGDRVIVFWNDNTKTIVKMDDEESKYDPEKAIMAAYTKKILSYMNTARERSLSKLLNKWIAKYEEEKDIIEFQLNKIKDRKKANNMKTASDSIIIETGGHSFNTNETPVDYIINESVENADNKE